MMALLRKAAQKYAAVKSSKSQRWGWETGTSQGVGIPPDRCLVLLLRTGRISNRALHADTEALRLCLPSEHDLALHKALGERDHLSPAAEVASAIVPVLEAQGRGARRWCGYCLKLSPTQDLILCKRCGKVGYCNRGCQRKHFNVLGKGGHEDECVRLNQRAEAAAKRGYDSDDDDHGDHAAGGAVEEDPQTAVMSGSFAAAVVGQKVAGKRTAARRGGGGGSSGLSVDIEKLGAKTGNIGKGKESLFGSLKGGLKSGLNGGLKGKLLGFVKGMGTGVGGTGGRNGREGKGGDDEDEDDYGDGSDALVVKADRVLQENYASWRRRPGDDVTAARPTGVHSGRYLYSPEEISSMVMSAGNGRWKVVRALLRKGVPVDKTDHHDGKRPIHMAAEFGHIECVRELLRAGADINASARAQGSDLGRMDNVDHGTPVALAAYGGHDLVVKLLVEHRGSVGKEGSEQEEGCDLNRPSVLGTTPLGLAASVGHVSTCRLLMDHGALPDLTDPTGATPLFVAARDGNLALVKALLFGGASKDIGAAGGMLPIEVATLLRHEEVVSVLRGEVYVHGYRLAAH